MACVGQSGVPGPSLPCPAPAGRHTTTACKLNYTHCETATAATASAMPMLRPSDEALLEFHNELGNILESCSQSVILYQAGGQPATAEMLLWVYRGLGHC